MRCDAGWGGCVGTPTILDHRRAVLATTMARRAAPAPAAPSKPMPTSPLRTISAFTLDLSACAWCECGVNWFGRGGGGDGGWNGCALDRKRLPRAGRWCERGRANARTTHRQEGRHALMRADEVGGVEARDGHEVEELGLRLRIPRRGRPRLPEHASDEVARADVVRVARRRVRERPSQAKLGGVRILGSVRCGLGGLAFQTRDGLAVRDGKPDLAPRWG